MRVSFGDGQQQGTYIPMHCLKSSECHHLYSRRLIPRTARQFRTFSMELSSSISVPFHILFFELFAYSNISKSSFGGLNVPKLNLGYEACHFSGG